MKNNRNIVVVVGWQKYNLFDNLPGAGSKRSAKQGVGGQRGGGGRPCHHSPCYRRPHLYRVRRMFFLPLFSDLSQVHISGAVSLLQKTLVF